MATAKKVAIAVKKGVDAEGINIASNNEPAAGQLVFHTHVHVIPRYSNDGFRHWPAKPGFTKKEFGETAKKSEKYLISKSSLVKLRHIIKLNVSL